MSNDIKILWADDEIDLLKPHVLFLEQKGFKITTVNSGDKVLDLIKKEQFDIIFLDENMPGMSGLDVLPSIKAGKPSLPVIMITKSEEEHLMEDAIGSRISDYLIKPVHPNQILLAIKKNLDTSRLINEKTTSNYREEFSIIGATLSDKLTTDGWIEVFRKLVFWELELEKTRNEGMSEIFDAQKNEANQQFYKSVVQNYLNWINERGDDVPLMSHRLFNYKIAPYINNDSCTYMVLIDNLRYDQWNVIKPVLSELFRIEKDELYFSILPTATQFSRNAIFSGLLPSNIARQFPNLWKEEGETGGKNLNEQSFIESQLIRLRKDVKFTYNKITNLEAGKKLAEQIHDMATYNLNVIVYNFVDMLSHARTDMEVIKELAQDEAAYRSLTLSWFEHSPLLEIFRKIAEQKSMVIVTTDHGSVRVKNPVKVIGDRNTSTNLRYKQGRNLNYNPRQVFEIKKPEDAFLSKANISSSYIFAGESDFFVYPNSQNHFIKYYKDTFQHGGISMEEMLLPVITMYSKII